MYLGNGWMMHSTGSTDGPVIEWVNDGYYHDIFVWGRRIIGAKASPGPHLSLEQLAAGEHGPSYRLATSR